MQKPVVLFAKMLEKFVQIFIKVQYSAACHQKYVNVLRALYKKTLFDEFADNFMLIMMKIFEQKFDTNNIYVKRALEFFSTVCAHIAIDEENKNNLDNNESSPFLSNIIPRILQYNDLNYVGARFYSSKFIGLILSNIHLNLQLDDSLYNEIQNKMILRLEDNKTQIRLQAISVLSFLQCPTDPTCPVIQTFLKYLNDSNKDVRHDIIKLMGVNKLTLSKIVERIDDINETVRSMTYRKFSEVGPRYIKIVDRILMLKRGFNDNNENVKIAFHNMLRKWLLLYEGNYLNFLQSLYLASSEEDFTVMRQIGKSIIEFFLESDPIEGLIEILPIENKLIPEDHFKIEILLYWKCIVNYFQSLNHLEDYLDEIIPELTTFCSYIESIISKKSQEEMDDYIWIEYQFELLNLFEIAEGYDFSDEVGRCALHNLITDILIKYHFNDKVLTKIIEIYFKTSTSIDFFIDDTYQIISQLREPYRDESEIELRIIDFQQQDNNEITIIADETPVVENDLKLNKITCLCLDILIKVLELPAIKKLNSNLNNLKDDFLLPLLINMNLEIHWRVLKCLSLFCYIDKETTKCSYQILLLPILNYKYTDYSECKALEICIQGLIDLFRIYGRQLISIEHDNIECEDLEIYSPESWFPEILLKILNDGCNRIKITALKVLCHTTSIFPLSSSVLTEILLKWFVLNSNQTFDAVHNTYGFFIETYFKQIKNSKEVLRKTIKPVLSKVIRAPADDPVSKISIDDLIRFYATIISTGEKEMIESAIKDLLTQISRSFTIIIQQSLTKILLNIELPTENFDENDQIPHRILTILPGLYDQLTKRNVTKFLDKLRNRRCNEGVDENGNRLPTPKPQIKRKKSRKRTEDKSTDSSDYQIESITSSSERNSSNCDRITTTIIDETDSDNDSRAKIISLID